MDVHENNRPKQMCYVWFYDQSLMLLTMTSSSTEAVSKEDIHELLEHSVKNTHKVKDGDIKVWIFFQDVYIFDIQEILFHFDFKQGFFFIKCVVFNYICRVPFLIIIYLSPQTSFILQIMCPGFAYKDLPTDNAQFYFLFNRPFGILWFCCEHLQKFVGMDFICRCNY